MGEVTIAEQSEDLEPSFETRYTDITAPRHLVLGERGAITVRLTRAPEPDSRVSQPLTLQLKQSVEIYLHAQPNEFEVISEPEWRLIVEPDRDTELAAFLLKAINLGRKFLALDFWQNGALIGTVRLRDIYTRQALLADHRRAARSLGDLLFILERWSEAVDGYRNAVKAGELLYHLATTPQAQQAELAELHDLPARLAFALAEALALDAAPLDRLTAEDRVAFETVRDQIRNLQAEAQASEETPGRRAFLTLSQQLGTYYDQLGQVVERICRYMPDFFPEPVFADVQAAAQSTPLVYLLVTPAGGLALIVQVSGIRSVWLDVTEDELEAWLVKRGGGAVVGGYLQGQLGMAPLPEILAEVLPLLSEKIMQPLAATLTDVFPHPPMDRQPQPIVLIPTGLLTLLPLHAITYLVNGQERAFLDEFVVTYVPSARALSHSQAAVYVLPGGSPMLFAIGNPLVKGAQPLAFAKMEVEGIAPLFGEGATALYETQAIRPAVEAGLSTATYLHLSCHGQFDPAQPLDSGLILTGGDRLTFRGLLARPTMPLGWLCCPPAKPLSQIIINSLMKRSACQPGFCKRGCRVWSVLCGRSMIC